MSGFLRVYFVDDVDLVDVYDKFFLFRFEIENIWVKMVCKYFLIYDINLVNNKICNIFIVINK